jgi:glucose/arabinose dehydrogenase
LAFGPRDDLLYIGLGDGGGAGDPLEQAQDPTSLLGKLLRIDVESGDPPTYTVPVSNPYTQTPGYRDEIWALGLRNPWRFAFDPLTGDLYIGDVGQNRYEEINYQPASSPGGENYGWDIMEGTHCFDPEQGCDTSGLVLPVAEYAHNGDCSVTGGLVHRDPDHPELDGIYFYADYCSGRIWALQRVDARWESRLVQESSLTITSFGVDQSGGQWLTRYADAPDGAIYRLVGAERAYLPLILR